MNYAKHLRRGSLLLVALLLLGATDAWGQADVTRSPWPAPTVNEFDGDDPPDDLPDDEDAEAKGAVSIDATNGIDVQGDGTNFEIKSIDVTLTGGTTIRQPDDATEKLKEHKLGHDDLFKCEYEENAKKKVEAALAGLVGKKYVGVGSTPQERFNEAADRAEKDVLAALDRAKKAIEQQFEVITEKYDKLTDHGKNDKSREDGVKEAKAERDKAPDAGDKVDAPDDSGRSAGSGNQSGASYDEQTGQLSIDGPLFITNTEDPFDPLRDLGQVVVDDMIVVGPLPNGATLVSDSLLKIFDSQSGELLLDAILFEQAIMPSSLPGFSHMLQGYLDVPPPDVPGINNTINSPFLNQLNNAMLNGELTRFWYFSDQSLLSNDPNANTLLLLGVAPPRPQATDATVPEPVTLLTWALGVFTLAISGHRRRLHFRA